MKSEIPNGTKDDRNTNSCYCQQLHVCPNSYSFPSVIYTENCGTVYYDCMDCSQCWLDPMHKSPMIITENREVSISFPPDKK